MSQVREFLAKKSLSDPRWSARKHKVFTLLRELPEEERVHGRLANRYWMVTFEQAGADYPYAILAEYDDDRGCYDVVKEEDRDNQVTAEVLDWWYECERRMGDW